MDRISDTTPKPTYKEKVFMIIGIILVAANLRAALTSVGPLVDSIHTETGLSSLWIGMISTLPLLAFAVLSLGAPQVARRIGTEKMIFISLVVLTTGILIRSVPSIGTLFLGTILIGMAIAIGNVLLPGLIKSKFPLQMGLMTGVYTMVMNLFAALAAGVSFPLAQQLSTGWRGSLLVWAGFSAVAIFLWFPQLKNQARAASSPTDKTHVTGMFRSPLAWQVTLFMGLQSLNYYVCITWIPQILHSQGTDLISAGYMLSLMQLVSIPFSLLIPILAGKRKSQSGIAALTALCALLGFVGLFSGGGAWLPLWIVLLGFSHGAGISLALLLFTLRAANAEQAAQLSGMAQSIGYLLAAAGPALLGYVYDLTQVWTLPLLLLIITSVIQLISGLGAGRNVTVSERSVEQKKGELAG